MAALKNIIALEFNHIESQVFSRYFRSEEDLNYLGNYRIASGLWNTTYPHDIVLINISSDNYRNCVSFLRHYPRTSDCQIFFTANTYFDQLTQLVQTNANAQIMMKPLRWDCLLSSITEVQTPVPSLGLGAKKNSSQYLSLIDTFINCTNKEIDLWIDTTLEMILPDGEIDCDDALSNCKKFVSYFIYTLTRDLDADLVIRLSQNYNDFLHSIKSICRTKALIRLMERFLRCCYNAFHPSYVSLDEERISDLKNRISHYVDAEIDFSLESIAQEMHISTSYLSRMFNKIEKVNYKDYILQLRLEKACQLLSNTNQTVEEIALHCGYRESSSFSRAFKGHHHLSPINYRKQQTSR